MKAVIFVTSAMLVIGITTPVCAQFEGPGSGRSKNVQAILENPVDDTHVTLRGHIVEQTSKEHYTFSDGTGNITVKIKDDDFPKDQKVTPEMLVEISGEVDKKFFRSPEIKVKQVKIVSNQTQPSPADSNRNN